MTRIVKDPDVRRNEILNAAQQLFYTKGYEQTAVRDIINAIGIAKGTFYYYFHSKEELLDAMVVHLLQQVVVVVEPMVDDPQLSALEKLQKLFADTTTLKLENRALIETLLPVWYKDENAIMREKMKAASSEYIAPLFTRIVQQGVAQGVFDTPYPDEIGLVILQMGENMSEAIVKLMVEEEWGMAAFVAIQRLVTVYQHAMIRLLGAPANSITLIDMESYRQWFTT